MERFGRTCAALAAVGVVSTLTIGCSAPTPYKSTLDPLALQQMQTHEFETTKERLYASVVSVFQDMGFTILAGDLATGLVSAKSPTVTKATFGAYLSVTIRASAFVEVARPGFARIRLNFVESRNRDLGYGPTTDNDLPNEQPDFYDGVFLKIREALFVRDAANPT